MDPEHRVGTRRKSPYTLHQAEALAADDLWRPGMVPEIHAGRGAEVSRARRALDQLDRRIAAALQINPRATWRQIAAAVESTEDTTRRRAERLFAAGLIRTTAISDNAVPTMRVLLQFTCGPAHASRVAEALADRADVRFVSLVTGPVDVVAEMLVSSNRDLARVLLHDLPLIQGITSTTTETVLRNFKIAYDWSYDLIGPRAAELGPPARPSGDTVERVPLEPVDLRILTCLEENGRYSFTELAARCGITESMARRHVDHLFSRAGVRPITLVDPYMLGYDVELLLWLRVDLAQLEQIATALAARREVRYVSATSGYRDLVCEVILRAHSDTYAFFTTVLAALPGIRQVDVASELLTLKRSNLRLDWGEHASDHRSS
ncbi:MAG TPA: Lrp/AsnC family transcriptional regulator [Chloroflexota bacterium]|jgi:DNA-binding Lrp family transcriptional regulator|nr:Lrp/AsnC family transcriptional regulator [Chloroflexota bacterium]